MRPWSWCALLAVVSGCQSPPADGAGDRARLLQEVEQLRAEKAARDAERMEARITQSIQAAVDGAVARGVAREVAALKGDLGAAQEAAVQSTRALDAKVAALARDVAQALTASAASSSGDAERERRSAAQFEQLMQLQQQATAQATERAAAAERTLAALAQRLEALGAAQERQAAAEREATRRGAESRSARDALLEELRTTTALVREALVEQGRRQAVFESSLRELQAGAARQAESLGQQITERLLEFGRGLQQVTEQVRALQSELRTPAVEEPARSRPAEAPASRRLTLPEPRNAPVDAAGVAPESRARRSADLSPTVESRGETPSPRGPRPEPDALALPRPESAPVSRPAAATVGDGLRVFGRPPADPPAPPGIRAIAEAWAMLRDPVVALPALVVIVSCIVALMRRRPAAPAPGPVPAPAPLPVPLAGPVEVAPAVAVSTVAAPAGRALAVARSAPTPAAAGSPPPPRLILLRVEGGSEGGSRREQLERALAVARTDVRVLVEPEPKADVRSDGSAALRCYVAGFLPADEEALVRRRLEDALLVRVS
jgi:hypothetical protein